MEIMQHRSVLGGTYNQVMQDGVHLRPSYIRTCPSLRRAQWGLNFYVNGHRRQVQELNVIPFRGNEPPHPEIIDTSNIISLYITRPLNPTPFSGYLILYIEDTRHTVRYPKEGVGFKGLGKDITHSPGGGLFFSQR